MRRFQQTKRPQKEVEPQEDAHENQKKCRPAGEAHQVERSASKSAVRSSHEVDDDFDVDGYVED